MVAGNVTFPIYNSDGTSFNGLELKKSVYESVVMSLGDKITGDVYYKDNTLAVTMREYIEYKQNPEDENEEPIRYSLVNPPTIVREGMVSDNGELKGMTKYSFTFYHPMYMLGNFPLCDVAVSSDQQRYLSENKTFFWIGNLTDFVAKLNKNLENTEWYCVINDSVSQADRQRLSEVMSFDKNTIADALKTGYETWDVPYIISIIPSTDPLYQQGKRFLIQYGLPSTEILVENAQHELVPFVFHFGQGVGLKNNSRTPRNNKIVTRIAGYGSEDNIQYGYPQIPYEGGDCQYPLYYGIVGGQRVQLIKHPFTRTHLMPSIYRETVNKKVNPMATGYDPTIELKDYYDADNTYENPIKPLEPSYEIHEFEKIKPELGQRSIVGVSAYSNKDLDSISLSSFISLLSEYYTESEYLKEKEELEKIINTIGTMSSNSGSVNTRAYYCDWSFTKDERYAYVKFESSALNFEYTVLMVSPSQDVEWDDTMDDDGNYVQSYFRITIPQLSFDLYASAAITQEMTINMRSGACLGCSFPVMVDWDDYKLNFYDADGNFAPSGSQRDYDKYPDSSQGQITLILQKETSTFGTLMPNIYQKPHIGDEFVILGISLPTSYITSAEARLDAEMKQYMRDNNVYYYDYPLKFDEHFLTTHAGILAQMDNNVIVRFDYAGTEHALYIKQVSVKYENKPLPTYDITLTDNIEVVLNQIGQVVDEVRRLHDNLGGVEVQPSNNYLRKDIDDTAYGMIRLIKGLQVGNRFVTGLLGEGGVFRKEEDGTTYLECDKMYVRMKAYFDTVEVRHYMHSAGNRVASNAGINCSRVEYIDSNGDVTQDVSEATLFRCYFRANDDGREVRNDFIVGDLAFCRETNINTDSVDQHGYWRAVVGRNANGVLTDDGEGWIDLSVSDCQDGSGIPIAQDDIVQLGNKTDTTRQGAIIEFVSGADAPSYQIYQGINTYSLNGKNYIGLGYNSSTGRAYLNVYGDAYIGDPNESSYIRYNAGTRNLEIKAKISAQSTIDGETLAQFIAENTWTEEQIDALITAETDPLVDAIEEIQKQVDGSIETWFYDGVPTLSNLPASEWDTADEKNKHLGDLYYDNLTGYGYRFKYDELNRQWLWGRITDVDVVKALADAAKAQDTADHKRRVFVVQPTPPYDAGDLWVNATYPSGNTETNEQQSKYYDDVLRCNTSKAKGTTFAIADWSLASKYTDDQALEDFKANQYVTALTNGTINQNITNAQNAANTAQGTANSAATAAASAQAAAQAAEAHAATFDYIKQALGQKTDIEGGLILTSLIALRNGNSKIWSGINGAYSATAKGGGIAAWFGGAMVDKDVVPSATDYAKSLFRFDGSGYVASGNLSWDKSGNVTIQGYSINATTLQVGGNAVATQAALADYVTLATDQTIIGHKTFGTGNGSYIQIGAIRIVYDSTNNALKIVASNGSGSANLYATGGITALGEGSGGSGGGIDMTTVWTALGNATNEQINATHLSNALSAYNPTSNFKTINGNSIIGTGDIVVEGGGGTVTSIKVGTTAYNPVSGVVTLPEYATATQLSNYLPLSGGTMANTNLVANLNADLLDGHDSTYFANLGTTWDKTVRQNGYILELRAGTKSTSDNPFSIIGGNAATVIQNLPEAPTYGAQLAFGFDSARVVYRNRVNSLSNSGWVGIIAGSADKLVTPRTIWGQSFDGSANVDSTLTIKNGNLHLFVYPNGESGIFFREEFASDGIYNLSILTHDHTGSAGTPDGLSINGFDGVSFCTGSNTRQERMRINYSGNVGIGTTSPAYLLHINGTFYASGNSSIGGTFGVTGATTFSSTLDVTGNTILSGTLSVSKATTLSSTLGVTGLLTASGGVTIPSGKTLTIGDAVLSWDSTNQGIKITKGLYSQTFISALGQGSSGSSGIDMATVWSALGNATTEQINATHLSNALSAYNPTSNFKTINGNSIIGTGDIVIQGGGGTGTVTAVKVGTTTYSPTDGVVSLPAYPSTLDDIADGSTRKLVDYLPLAGGTMTGQINSLSIKPRNDNQSYIGDASRQYFVVFAGHLNSGSNKPLAIASSNGDDDIYIDTSHNIGIGHKSPTAKLDISGTLNVSAATTLSSGLFVTGTNSSADDGITITLQDKRYIGLILTNGKSSSETETAELFVDTTAKGSYWYFNSGGTSYTIVHPKKSGTIALTSDLDDYLPLTGGKITANSVSPLIINSTSSSTDSYITFQKDGSAIAWYGYDRTLHTMIQRAKSPYQAIGIKDDGTPYYVADARTAPFTFYELYHSGNFNPSDYLPLTGGTITSASQKPLTIKTTSTSRTDACYMQIITKAGKIAEFGYYGGLGAYIQNMSSTGGTTVSINDNGNVGISVTTPSYKLHVGGTLNATEIYEGGTLLSSLYLPLSGGTMTGTINCKNLVPIAHNTYQLGSNSVGFQVLYTMYVNGIANKPLDLAAADGSGDIYITAAHLVGIATKSPSYQLHVNGTFYASGNSSIGGTLGVTGATTLSSTLGVKGAATLSSTLSVSGNSTLSGYVGVGTAASSSYALKVKGVVYASTGVYSGGYVTALSDARHKDVQGNVNLTVSEVANAPSVKFLWKDRRQEGLQVGSIAQYWKKVMPEAVVENADGELTMSYGVIALLSAISIARKVEDLERRVVNLEKENKLLKEQLNVA